MVDEAESEWARLENLALPEVRGFLNGRTDTTTIYAVKVLAAIHFARSYGFDVVWNRVLTEARRDSPNRIAVKEEIQRAFRQEHGREPHSGEVQRYVCNGWTRSLATVSHRANGRGT